MALVAAFVVASDDGRSHMITIPIPIGGSVGIGTGRGNYGGGTIRDS